MKLIRVAQRGKTVSRAQLFQELFGPGRMRRVQVMNFARNSSRLRVTSQSLMNRSAHSPGEISPRSNSSGTLRPPVQDRFGRGRPRQIRPELFRPGELDKDSAKIEKQQFRFHNWFLGSGPVPSSRWAADSDAIFQETDARPNSGATANGELGN